MVGVALVVVVLILGGIWYGIAGRAVAWGTGLVMNSLQGASLSNGIKVTSASCSDTSVSGPLTAKWHDFQLTLEVDAANPALEEHSWRIATESAKLKWRGIFSGTLGCELRNVSVEPVREAVMRSATRSGRRVYISDLRLHFDRVATQKKIRAISPVAFKSAIGDFARDIKRWAAGEGAQSAVELAGTLHFRIDQQPVDLALRTRRQNGQTMLVSDAPDIQAAADAFGDPLTEAETEISARHPLRIPALLVAKTTAEQGARRTFPADSAKRDAYRHVTWSWLLCDRFGTEFARQITSAHEEGSDNTAQESERDLANNRLGRSYWEQNVTFKALKQKVENDPDVALRGE